MGSVMFGARLNFKILERIVRGCSMLLDQKIIDKTIIDLYLKHKYMIIEIQKDVIPNLQASDEEVNAVLELTIKMHKIDKLLQTMEEYKKHYEDSKKPAFPDVCFGI